MWFTGCLAAFALLQLLLFWWQLSIMRREIRERGDKERPMVFLHSMELRHANGRETADLPPCGMPVVSFANYGSTPAIVVRIFLQHCFDNVPAEPPRYTLAAELADGTVIEPGKKLADLDLNHRIDLPEGRRSAIEAGEAKLWIYGRIDVRDYMGHVHEHRFCRRWAQGSLGSGMAEDGPDSYHSNRESDRVGRVASVRRRLAEFISGSAS